MPVSSLVVKRIAAVSTLLLLMVLTTPVAAEPAAQLGPISVLGDEPSQLSLGVGAFNFDLRARSRYDGRAAEAVGELRLGSKWFGIGPLVGLMVNTSGGAMGYAGLYSSFRYRRVIVTPEVAIGAYGRGAGKYLGGGFEFREELSADWQFHNGQRLGIRYAHISNASLARRNPGEQELLLVYTWPLP